MVRYFFHLLETIKLFLDSPAKNTRSGRKSLKGVRLKLPRNNESSDEDSDGSDNQPRYNRATAEDIKKIIQQNHETVIRKIIIKLRTDGIPSDKNETKKLVSSYSFENLELEKPAFESGTECFNTPTSSGMIKHARSIRKNKDQVKVLVGKDRKDIWHLFQKVPPTGPVTSITPVKRLDENGKWINHRKPARPISLHTMNSLILLVIYPGVAQSTKNQDTNKRKWKEDKLGTGKLEHIFFVSENIFFLFPFRTFSLLGG